MRMSLQGVFLMKSQMHLLMKLLIRLDSKIRVLFSKEESDFYLFRIVVRNPSISNFA